MTTLTRERGYPRSDQPRSALKASVGAAVELLDADTSRIREGDELRVALLDSASW